MMDDLWTGAKRRPRKGGQGPRRRATLYRWLVGLLVIAAVAGAIVLGNANARLLRGFYGKLFQGGQQTAGAYLGVTVDDVDAAAARTLGLSDRGVVITKVLRGSPAANAGLQPGDAVVRYESEPVSSSSELRALLAASSAGDTVKIVVDRKGTLRTFFVELGESPTAAPQLAAGTAGEAAAWACTLAPLDAALAKQLSLPTSTSGVVVVAVDPSGLAYAAGLRVGDVITAVNREPTPDLGAFYNEVDEQQMVVLQVLRNGQLLNLRIQPGSASPPTATIAGALTAGTNLPQRIAVAANGTDLSAQLAPRFGTAPYFIIADLGSNRFVAIQNNVAPDARGYGVVAAQLVAAQGVQAAIAGGFGPPAYDALQGLRILPFTAPVGAVVDVLWQYRAGQLPQLGEPTLPGFGYARNLATVGGNSDDDDEEQSGYRGMPQSIPPRGKYEPDAAAAAAGRTVAGTVAAQATAGSSQRSDYCYCPICNKLVPHPPSVACSQLACPLCGNRLMNYDAGGVGANPLLLPSAPAAAQLPGASQRGGGVATPTPTPSVLPGTPGTASTPSLQVPSATLAPAPQPGTSGLYLNQTQYCYCPVCKALHPKPAGVPCSFLACPNCGARLLSLNAGSTPVAAQPPTAASTATTPSAPLLPMPMGQSSMTAAIPRMGPPMIGGQPTTIRPMGQATAGMMTGGQPTTIFPMGQATAGMMTGGQPTTIPPMGQATAGMPAAGPTNIPSIAYSTQGVTIAGPTNIPPIAYSTQGVTIAGPTSIPPGGRTQPRGQSAAGTTVGGQPTTIPPTGQPAPGALVGGKPDTIPPMGPPTDQGSAAVTVAGSGTIPPLPQSAAGSAGTLLQPGALQGSIDGNCVCPKCGRTVPHVRGTACYTVPCPSCGTPMLREGTVFAPQVTAGSSPAAQLPTVPPLPSSPQWPGLGPGPGALPQMPPLLAPSPPTATPLAPTALDGPLTVAGDSSGKICIAATGPTIDAQVAPLFGRAPYFLVFGLGTFEVLPNPNVYDRTGVGVQSAQLVVSEGAKAVITYDISVKALEEFQRLRVTVYSGVNGTARDALQWYQAGRLSPASLSDAQAPEEHEEHNSGKGKGSSSSRSL